MNTKFNISECINVNENLLTVTELLEKINYPYNKLYLDKFWDCITDEKWLYINSEMLIWMGYSKNEIKKGKLSYSKLLDSNFDETVDYKMINNKEFKNNAKSLSKDLENVELHNKTKHLMISPDCFKQSLMLLKTDKAKEIRSYYIALEKIFKLYLEYQNEYKLQYQVHQNLKIQNELSNINRNTKLEKHKYLVDKFKNKRCVYIIEIKEGVYIKIGSTQDIYNRLSAMNTAYSTTCIVLDIFECVNNFREVEQNILNNTQIKKNLYKEKINGVMPKEIVELCDSFNYEQLYQIVKDNVKKHIFLNPIQLLEKQKLDYEMEKLKLVNKLLEHGYDPNLLDKFTISINFNNNTNNNTKDSNVEQATSSIAKQVTSPIVEQATSSINNSTINNSTISNHLEDIEDQEDDDEPLVFKPEIKKIKARGRPIIKIDPNNLSLVLNVYESMYYLLRANEGVNYLKSGVQDACRDNKLYKGYRWAFIEKGEDPYSYQAAPTNMKITNRIVEPIVKLNSAKDEVLEVYNTQEECFINNKLKKEKLNKLIKTKEIHDNVYYIKMSECDSHILDTYTNKINKVQNRTNSKPVISINPLTKEEIIFNTISEVPIKIGGSIESIRIAIANKTLYNGYFWKYN